MAYTQSPSRFPWKHLAAAAASLTLAAAPALAQNATPTLNTVAYSTSSGNNPFAGEDIDGRSLVSAPDGTMPALSVAAHSPQYGGGYGGNRGGYHGYHDNSNSRWSHVTFEAGGGFTAPLGDSADNGFTNLIQDGSKYGAYTWGGNFLVGAGWRFTKRFSVLGEFSYYANKIPGRTLSAVYNQDPLDYQAAGIDQLGGNQHTIGLTAEPIFYYYTSDKHSLSGYVIGGGGWYHKSTNFTTPIEQCDYYGFCGVYNQTFSSFSDNAGGLNIGTGVTVSPFGEASKAKLFAEVRYVWVDTPSYDLNSTSGDPHTGSQELLPISFGIRF